MALAPLRTGPHTVRAGRLAFATPVAVREAAGGHWITITQHYSHAAKHLAAKAEEHRAAHARLGGKRPVRESATAAPRFIAPVAR